LNFFSLGVTAESLRAKIDKNINAKSVRLTSLYPGDDFDKWLFDCFTSCT